MGFVLLQSLISYVVFYYTIISYLFREQSKLLTRGAGDDLRTEAEGRRQQFPSHLQHRGTIVLYIATNPLKMIMSAHHTIKKLGHDIVLKEIQHFFDYLFSLTGMTHCASFSGMEQFGSGSRGTVNCFTLPAILKFVL